MLFKNYNRLIMNGSTPAIQKMRKDILDMCIAAVDAVNPYNVVKKVISRQKIKCDKKRIDLSQFHHLYVIGFGKASVGMAQAVVDLVPGVRGVVITNDPAAKIKGGHVEVILGGHPLPTKGSIVGTEKILSLIGQCDSRDCILVLISGGGSSLLCKPRIPLSDLQKTTDLLLKSGANIEELNTIRKHLSFVKGGLLATHTKAMMISLIISDIVLDPISSIASGPTSPDASTFADAKKILQNYGLWSKVPETVKQVIKKGIAGETPETLKKDNPVFEHVHNCIIANNKTACTAVVKKAKKLGYHTVLLSTSVIGEARTIGPYLIEKARQSLSPKKTVFIAGGEPVVTVQGSGSGGRNQELVLSCVEEIAGTKITMAAFATDGIDGNSDAAGALADGVTLQRAKKKNMDPTTFLKENNSYTFFTTLHDTLLTGPTGTNVMDIHLYIKP
ncbi:MAG: glycerate kinase [Methanobacteriota archaeon]